MICISLYIFLTVFQQYLTMKIDKGPDVGSQVALQGAESTTAEFSL